MKSVTTTGTNGKIPKSYFTSEKMTALNSTINGNGNENDASKQQFESMISSYIESNPIIKKNNQTAELEVRFNATSKYTNYITKIDYDNVIKQLYHLGFDCANKSGQHLLRISNEYTDAKTGYTKISNIRAELAGLDLIQEYCKTNSIQKVLDLPSTLSTNRDKIKFTRKTPSINKTTGERIPPVDFKNFGFRVSYQMEEDFTPSFGVSKDIISKWNDSKKLYRFLNRARFEHPTIPIYADLSIVKMSNKTKRVPIPTFTVEESGIFKNQETYEIELEIDNTKVGIGTEYDTPAKLLAILRKMIRYILSAFQKTSYPISFSEREDVQQMYLNLLHGNTAGVPANPRRIYPKDFIGPSSYTLQLSNIVDISNKDENMKTPNIRKNMTVTDKADGERRMLFIAPNGRVYMIDTNMNIIFTGYIVNTNKPPPLPNTGKSPPRMTNSLIDGEFIKYNKNGELINLFAGFDIYFIDGKSVREYAFTKQTPKESHPEIDEEEPVEPTDMNGQKEFKRTKSEIPNYTNKSRLQLLNTFVSNISLIPVEKAETSATVPSTLQKVMGVANVLPSSGGINTACNFRLQCKTFYMTTDETTIFQACSEIITKSKDGLFEYNTDGLIFTPSNTGVGSSSVGVAGPLHKITWDNSFKWKPPEFNTIDFLVTVKKDPKGNDEIHNILQEGTQIQQYKTLTLMCGFDINKHSYINPYMEVINDRMPSPTDLDDTDTYIPVPFQPSDPFDSTAYACNIMLQNVGGNEFTSTGGVESNSKTLVMKTVEGEYFEEDMIVEFSYDLSKKKQWRWVPLRVRYDKTSELRAGIKNYGNAYHVANSNWMSIHNPITENMIVSGEGIPKVVSSFTEDDIYYNNAADTGEFSNRTNSNLSLTRSMRDFHNLFVKSTLIVSVSNRDNILIDYACGKGGDLPKWIHSKLAFVFGVDVSRDNIHNRLDGVCSRYINYRKKYKKCPSCLFSHGNSGLNIRTSQQAFLSDKDKEIARAIFGKGPKDSVVLGKGVYKNYGIAKDGFHISSVQFALHYFFENKVILNQFLRNLSECTCLGGYFIGTCYDGETVFQKLRTVEKGECFKVCKNNTDILKINKQYAQTGFSANENSLGYAIDVFQESINKTIREYLVNYKYLTRMLENYGFVELTTEEAHALGLPNSSGLFGELFQQMESEVRQNPQKKYDYKSASDMTSDEKTISFMNRYFVFKKVRNVDAESMAKTLSKSTHFDEDANIVENEPVETEKTIVVKHKVSRKLKVPKIVIDKYEPVREEIHSPPKAFIKQDSKVEIAVETSPKTVLKESRILRETDEIQPSGKDIEPEPVDEIKSIMKENENPVGVVEDQKQEVPLYSTERPKGARSNIEILPSRLEEKDEVEIDYSVLPPLPPPPAAVAASNKKIKKTKGSTKKPLEEATTDKKPTKPRGKKTTEEAGEKTPPLKEGEKIITVKKRKPKKNETLPTIPDEK